MQGLYQIQITGYGVDIVLKQFLEGDYLGNADIDYFKAVSYTHLTLPTICSV